jgi:hypothetical protein
VARRSRGRRHRAASVGQPVNYATAPESSAPSTAATSAGPVSQGTDYHQASTGGSGQTGSGSPPTSAATTPGPTSLGGAVGNNCNPKCS